ncbi:MAG: hypothetical protein IJH71_04745 [Eubacterium sp.]|nr:hypothetical protein [Eubacterium sp.]
MMISPEAYYEEYLCGKSQEEVLDEIVSLKGEISSLKRELEGDGLEPTAHIMPGPLTRIKCNREYLEKAKQAYEEAGGKYEPTEEEQKDQAFNEALTSMKSFVLETGGFFGGYEKNIFTISGEKVLYSVGYILLPRPSNLPICQPFTRDEFLQGIADLHMGEWKEKYINPEINDGTQWKIRIEYADGREPVQIYGSNAFPYNFDYLTDFLEMGVEEALDE